MAIKQLELLSPAKNLECGIAAINCGADAVYIGSPKYGARAAAGNSISDIEKLVIYAHKYWAKVYVTLNTIIYDEELDDVKQLINKLYESGVDALIFQDMSLLQMDIPPIPLFASTQTHNYEIERIKLLDASGVRRIILARELSLEQISKIHKNVDAELEFFVHGALCVSMSGQCYMSAAMLGRSANRGECAQPCRLKYNLIDSDNKIIIKDKHLLSLHDFNLSAYLNDLILAGISSFKIEGRLKDIGYVKNITAYYRNKIDGIIESNSSLSKSSTGKSEIHFTPDPEKSFNRGFTDYFINGKGLDLASLDTPKSLGQYLGKVSKINNIFFTVETDKNIVNGDGLCFFDDDSTLTGMNVSCVESNNVFTDKPVNLKIGAKIYRNYDHTFENELKKESIRKIKVTVKIDESENGVLISATDEDGISVDINETIEKVAAVNKKMALENILKQFSKSGDTIFKVENVTVNIKKPIFIPLKLLNQFRRNFLLKLENRRIEKHIIEKRKSRKSIPQSVQSKLDYKTNITNIRSKEFYANLGAIEIEDGFELQTNNTDKILMNCKYCIKDELGLCNPDNSSRFKEPFYLVNNNKKYRLIFDCDKCEMKLILS